MFIATKVNAVSVPGTEKILFRHEFLEIMIRISSAKYRETGRTSTCHEALKIMLEGVIEKHETKPWQEFRDETLWTHEVEAVLKANVDALQRIYDAVFPKYEGDYGLKNCLDLVTSGSALQMSSKEGRYCFGMSKMTVKDEVS